MTSSSASLFFVLAGLILVSSLAKIGLAFASYLRCAYLGRQLADRMRRVLFERCLNFGKLYFDQANVGHIQHVLLDSTEAIITQLLTMQNSLTYFFMLITYLAIMLLISWRLTLAVMLAFPLAHYSVGWLVVKIKSLSDAHATARKEIGGFLSGIFSNILLVKAAANEDAEKRRFDGLSGEIRRLAFVSDEKTGLVIPVQETLFLALLLLVLFSLVFIVGRQDSSAAPHLLVYLFLLRKTSTALTVLGRFNPSLAAIHGPISDVLGLLSKGEEPGVPSGGKSFRGLSERIVFRKLTYAFPNKIRVLDDVSFSVEKGKMTAIVGPSGTGKTTLINLILRFYEPPPGAILLDGADLREFSLHSLRTRIAFVSQDSPLFNDTIRSNIIYPRAVGVTDEVLATALKRARLHDFIAKLPLGLDTVIGDRGIRLSGGEKQRVSIARAILKDAEILILDEATSSLDSQTEMLIQESIEALVKGRTSIVIAHRLSTIKNADKIVVIEGGRIVEQGTREELLHLRGRFHRYWETQKFE
jgi:subfamily B ATP-binding cassette protein MsbA